MRSETRQYLLSIYQPDGSPPPDIDRISREVGAIRDEMQATGVWGACVGGGIALGTHGTKAATRLGANLSPEPFSNIAIGLAEDVVAIGASFLMAYYPVVLIGIVVVFLGLMLWLTPKVVRALRNMLKGFRAKCYT